MTQFYKQGARKYLKQFWNYIDMVNIFGGFFNNYM